MALGELRRAEGRLDDAGAAFGRAVAVIDEMASGLSDPQRRETFLASAPVRAVRALGGGA